MIDKNTNNDVKLNRTELQKNKDLNRKYIIGLSILSAFILLSILLVFELISYITNVDFLAPFPGYNFIITPVCIAITFIIVSILNKTKYMAKIINSINKKIIWIKKYPHIYKILRFIYKHPIISAIVIGVMWAIGGKL